MAGADVVSETEIDSDVERPIEPIDALLKFLKKEEEEFGLDLDYHALFGFGTCVRFNFDQNDEKTFSEFDWKDYDFPVHGIEGRSTVLAKEYEDEAERVYREILATNVVRENHVDLVKKAYHQFLKEGYLHPDGPDANSLAVPLVDDLTVLYTYPNGSRDITNVFTPSLIEESERGNIEKYLQPLVKALGADFRRDDYMLPILTHIITPELEIIEIPSPSESDV